MQDRAPPTAVVARESSIVGQADVTRPYSLLRVAIFAVAVVAVGAALQATEPVAVPIVAALITALMLGPIADGLGRAGVPPAALAGGLVVLLAAILALLATLMSGPISDWIERAPEIGATLRQRLDFIIEPLQAAERIQAIVKSILGSATGALSVEVAEPGLGPSLVVAVSPAIGQLLVFFGALLFLLIGRERLRREVVMVLHGRKRRLAALRMATRVQHDLGVYFGTIAVINFGLGVVVALAMLAIGMPNPLVWGILAFGLNFIPYIGAAVMAGLISIGGLVSYESALWGLAPLAIYLVATSIEGQLVTPYLLGNRFAVNPLIVFLAIVFWSWLWGPAGALLAAPILVTGISIWKVTMQERRPKLPA
ncbi:AI-2E family transporter [Desertibaculum subflavum]|uniref:AI-2E family transporter n=1 Tax=Desertibaculum subflavum TaxID=2268458 RepID=UPI000E66D331